MQFKKHKSNKGITLISLVITIVILLILSGIGVSIIIGNDGMIGKTKDIAGNYEISTIKEQLQKDILLAERKKELTEEDIENILQNYGTVTRNGEGTVKGLNPTKYPSEEILLSEIWNGVVAEPLKGPMLVNGTYIDEEGKRAKVPSGFTVSTVTGETKIDEGLVVTAPDGSELVWIPVDFPVLEIPVGQTETQIKNLIDAGITNNQRYPMATKVVGENNYRGVLYNFTLDTSTTPNGVTIRAIQYSSTDHREPAILINTTYGDTDSNLSTYGIGLTQNAFQSQLQNEYNEMIESVIRNKGFYIGRYEASLNGGKVQSKKNQTSMTEIDWWQMYTRQKLYAEEMTGVTSGMIWGSQWDQVMVFMRREQNQYASNKPYILDPTGMGNYSGTTELDTWSIVAPTGCIAVKNIYDMAGNVFEWTMEVDYTRFRVSRGGSFSSVSKYTVVDEGGYGYILEGVPPSYRGRCRSVLYPHRIWESYPALLIMYNEIYKF